MKKLLLLIAMAGTSFSSWAQIEPMRTRYGIALEAGLPVGKSGDVYSLAIGGSLFLDYPVSPTFNVSGSAGFTNLTIKEEISWLGDNPSFIPLKVGAKYFFLNNLFAQAEVGAAVAATKGRSTAAIIAPGLGLSYPVSGRTNFEAGVRYESWAADGGSVDQVAFKAALKF
ncbi:hypothetical protein [Desertivirga arenae]|uniref:hypothetical protein n=1 Tax=Desertivirga arenae TaxID=2810309 RepID=UPI001A959DD5|nr:hypothetical protein [Pedobacter sp. SYSU D00823]